MKFRSLVVAFASALLVGMTACAPPTTTPTETSTVDVTFGPDQGTTRELPRCDGVAQTFTAGRSGQLDKVSLHVSRSGPVRVQVLVEITTLDGMGHPTANVLGSGTYDLLTAGLIDIELDVAAPVVAGTGYAMTVRDPTFCMDGGLALGAVPSTYDGGQQLVTSGDPVTWSSVDDSELVFRTWVR